MDLLARLEQDLAGRRACGSLAGGLRGWQARHPGLRRFDDIDTLIAACRDGQRSRAEVDSALSALCREAASGDDGAFVFLLWLLLPGLLLARARLAQIGVLASEDLTSEMVAGVWEAARRLPPSAQGVASRLVNSARWRAMGALRERMDWAARTTALPAAVSESEARYGQARPPSEPDSVTGAVRDGVLSASEAVLVHADHHALVEISQRLGISLSAARKRRHRARARLRSWLSEA